MWQYAGMPSSTAPAYSPTTEFADFNPSAFPNLGTDLDTEFNNLNTTLDAVQLNIADVRRSDGALKNGIVRQESLHSEIYAGLNTPGVWVTATAYVLRDSVVRDGVFYKCIVAHTSGTFATDLAALKWEELVDFADFSGPQLGDTTPTALSVGASATAGVAITASRVDHVHAIPVYGLLVGSTQTSGFTAVSNTRYIVNLAADGTITLPASPTAGDIVRVAVSGGYVLTLNPNGNKINGSTSNLTVGVDEQTLDITYTGSGRGWV